MARFAAIAAIDGRSPGEAVITLPAGAQLDTLPETAVYERSVDGLGDVSASLRVPTRLLSRTTVRLTGTVPIEPTVSVTMPDIQPRIGNSGGTATPPGYVVWNGRSYRLPGLDPGAVWSPTDADETRLPPGLHRLVGVPDRLVSVHEYANLPQPLRGGVDAMRTWLRVRDIGPMERRP